jgi:hypothetical protein
MLFAMAFTGADNANASNSTFNDVRQNQYNIGTIHLPPKLRSRLRQ